MFYLDSVEVKTPEELGQEEDFQKQVDATIQNTKGDEESDGDL